MLFPPLLGADLDVLRQALAVEPGLTAMDVAHVDKTLVGCILRAADDEDDEDVV